MVRRLSVAVAVISVLSTPTPAGGPLPLRQTTPPGRALKTSVASEAGALQPLEAAFDASTRIVTIKLAVVDPNGSFIPNLRRDNFAVYEDGLPQKNASVDVEHAPVALSVLLEGGSRYQELNTLLNIEIPVFVKPLRDALLPGDRVALYSYSDSVHTLVNLGEPPDKLDATLTGFRMAVFSEANFYDALVDLLGRTRGVTGRRALLLISTGLDTFSRATFNDVLAMAEKSETPIYGIGLAGFVRRAVTGEVGPLSKLDWGRANEQLRSLANVTGGRMYLRDTNLDVQALYDDFMEHLRVRYVITYAAPAGGMAGSKHTVRVALVDGSGSGPLRIVDAAGKAITARLSTEASYTR